MIDPSILPLHNVMEGLSVKGVHEQKQQGRCWVGLHVPVGRLSADECEAVAALADKYSGGEIRLTVEQNIVLPNVEKSAGL